EARDAMAQDLAEMGAMIESLLAFLGGEKNGEAPVRADVAVTVATVVDAFQDQGADVSYEGPDHLEMNARPLHLRRAVMNLIDNALHYGQRAHVTVERRTDIVLIRVEDDGPGIPEDKMEEVLKPFARLDEARGRNTRGLGLGLAIVAKAVEQEEGELVLANRPMGGLSVEIRLPLGEASPVR
ncbi:MAG TPA: ATP-binding protein, partial [Sphingobium sp.]|nr:ATP-binding protein [Sphingobium sp.]